jgi:hypothetical protein
MSALFPALKRWAKLLFAPPGLDFSCNLDRFRALDFSGLDFSGYCEAVLFPESSIRLVLF